MKHIKTLVKPEHNIIRNGSGCGECRSSCQSACKTSCTVGNQVCEQKVKVYNKGEKNKSVKF
jgi:predicted ribosomally synthesized six-cysteine peptide SCIFF